MGDNEIGDRMTGAENDAKSGIASAMETGSDLAGMAKATATEAGSTIWDAAIEAGKQTADAATKTYRQGAQAAEYVSRTTAEQPMVALLVAAAIGYGIAYLIHGR